MSPEQTPVTGVADPDPPVAGGILSRGWSSAHRLPLLLISAVIVAVNIPLLLQVVTNNPTQLYAGLVTMGGSTVVAGAPFIDPNALFVTQALGRLVVHDWLHGQVPWWNPYEGIGAPLAGEPQSAAFFPLVLVLVGAVGFVVFHVGLELIAGWSTYFLARRLGMSRMAGGVAGVAFGFCGTLVWFQHASANPVPFLPLALLGVERCREAVLQGRRGGWKLLGVGVGLSLLAGFPETAYIDGLLVAVWAVVRLGALRPALGPVLRKLAAAAVLGGLLAAPELVAFIDFLPQSYTGGHSGAFAQVALSPQALSQLLLPYGFGPIFGYASPLITGIWGSVGGYLGTAVALCALIGLTGRRLRPLRLTLGVWIFLGMGRTYGLHLIQVLVNAVPGLHSAAVYRYSPPSWDLAAIILAALAIDDLLRREVHPAVLLSACGVMVCLVGWSAAVQWHALDQATGPNHRHRWPLASAAIAVAVIAGVGLGGLLARRAPAPRGRRVAGVGRLLLPGALVAEATAMFAIPLLSAPTPVPIQTNVITFLRAHLGLQRFVTLGPLQPNLGSSYGISSLSVNDLPVPKKFATLVQNQLDPNTIPNHFDGQALDPKGLTSGGELTAHLAAYEAVGVRYVVTSPGGTDSEGSVWPPATLRPAPQMVYADAVARVYQLTSPAPFMSATGSQCQVQTQTLTGATVHCDGPASLTRLELMMPGWHATVNGRDVALHSAAGLWQTINLPAGTSRVEYSFTPPHGDLALGASLLGVIVLVLQPLVPRRTRRSATHLYSGGDGLTRAGGREPVPQRHAQAEQAQTGQHDQAVDHRGGHRDGGRDAAGRAEGGGEDLSQA